MPKIPSDLDRVARAKWRELELSVDPDSDLELLANYCRIYSSLIGVRKEKAALMKSGKWQTTVTGPYGKAKILNPLLTQENRLIASQTKMLKMLGLATSRDQVGKKQKSAAQDNAKWMDEIERIMSEYTMSNALRHAMMERTGLPYLDCCDDRLYTAEDQQRAEVLLHERTAEDQKRQRVH